MKSAIEQKPVNKFVKFIRTKYDLQSGDQTLPAGTRLAVRAINRSGAAAIDDERIFHFIRRRDFEEIKTK